MALPHEAGELKTEGRRLLDPVDTLGRIRIAAVERYKKGPWDVRSNLNIILNITEQSHLQLNNYTIHHTSSLRV
jgi:hypothetical protein